jgi:sugar lactone lactonase YvrE
VKLIDFQNKIMTKKIYKFSIVAMLSMALFMGCDKDDDMDGTPTLMLPDIVSYDATSQFPEGIEYDVDNERFIVSSAVGAGIGTVSIDGAFTTVISAQTVGENGVYGLQVDKQRNRLFAVGGLNFANPTGLPAVLYIFDLNDFSLLEEIDLTSLTGGAAFVNDVAIDANGDAYITDSSTGQVIKANVNIGNSTIESLFQDTTLSTDISMNQFGFNGIEYHEDGYFLVNHSFLNTLYKLALDGSSLSPVTISGGSIGGDGMYLDGDNLYIIVNNTPTPYVSKLTSSDNWVNANSTNVFDSDANLTPTAIVKAVDCLMVNNSSLGSLSTGNFNVTSFSISKAVCE